jgi:hypothetical protein
MQQKTVRYKVGHGGYVSEFDEFLHGFLREHPEVEEDRKRGWYKYWDRNVDLDNLEEQRQDAVKAKPYTYE